MRTSTIASVHLLVVLLAHFALPQETPVVIQDATILVGTGDTIDRGMLLFEQGKIVEVGRDLDVPDGVTLIDAEGLYLTPGLIDARSSFGLDGSSFVEDELMVPERSVLDDFEPEPDSEWLRSGVTTTYVSPGGQNVIGGLGAVVKLTGAVVRRDAGLSVSFGETALDAFETPTTRQGMVATLRQSFIRAQEDAVTGRSGRVLARALAEEVPVRVLANTPDDILTAIRFGQEFGLQVILDSAAGAHEVADAIAAAGVAVVVGPSIIGIGDGGPYELFAHTPANAARLYEAGVPIALSTFSRGSRSVALEAVVAKAHGLPEDATLRAVTRNAAIILGVADRLGSLEPGKDADMVLWENHPLGTWGETRRVIVDGETVFVR